jgi:hypothetical protein
MPCPKTIQISDVDNTLFTTDEQTRINPVFEAIRMQLGERDDLTPEQRASMDGKLDELVAASEKLGRKDWLTLVLATGFSLMASDLVPAHVVQHVVGLTLRGVAHMFGVDVPPLPIAS